MSDADPATLDRDALLALVATLRAEVFALRAEVERLARSGKRQAAPFSKGTRVEHPKRPGRKPGQGPFTRREAPAPEALSEPPVDVPVDHDACPRCGGELVADRVDEASVVDLPEVVRPRTRLFRVAVCRCKACGATARGRHPDLADDQRGATAHRLGPRFMAAAHRLHYGLGVPVRKLPELLRLLTGVAVTQGAITHDALRRAGAGKPVAAAYQALCDSVRASEHCHTDDTGWSIDAVPHWLMTFVTSTATVYQIRRRHRNEEVRELVPSDYQGVLITDRGKSYDAAELSGVKKQKCLSHVLRSLSDVLKTKAGRARWFAATLKALLKKALAMWRERRDASGPIADFEARASRLRRAITDHLRVRRLKDRDNQRLLDGSGPLRRRGFAGAFPGEARDRADEQPCGARAASGGDHAKDVALHEERARDASVRGMDERDRNGSDDDDGRRNPRGAGPADRAARPPPRLSPNAGALISYRWTSGGCGWSTPRRRSSMDGSPSS